MKTDKKFQVAGCYSAPQLRTLPIRIESGFVQSVGSDGLPNIEDDWTNEDFA
ncbi:MAG: hypothetical protein ACI35T_04485 [Alistipes sp.]